MCWMLMELETLHCIYQREQPQKLSTAKNVVSLEIREVSGRGEFFVLSVGFDSTFVCIQ